MAVRREYVSSLYRDLLGREGSDQEIEGHLGNPSEQSLRDLFLGSPEYTSQHGGQASWQDVGGVVTPTTPPANQWQTPGDSAPVLPDRPPNVSGGYAPAEITPPVTDQWSSPGLVTGGDLGRMTGYDAANWNNPAMQTAKYQVGRVVSKYDLSRPDALDGIVNELKQYFPKIRITNHSSGSVNLGQGDGDVDIIENYGAVNARGAWQPQNGSGGSGSGGGGGTARTGAGSGSASTLGDLRNVYTALGQQYAGPGDAGITNGELQQVGQDPLSLLISGALAKFIGDEGSTGFGRDVQSRLMAELDRGGEIDDAQVARRFESARELLDKGRRTMINDMRGDLGARNLLSEPGIPQGAEIGGIERITERIAPEFSRALRDIYTDEAARADTRLMSSLQLATGFSTDQARNLLAGIGEGTARQTALADIALRSLAQNQAWSQFLAQFGLERDKVMYDIQNGQIEDLLPILQAFIQLGGMANQGYI